MWADYAKWVWCPGAEDKLHTKSLMRTVFPEAGKFRTRNPTHILLGSPGDHEDRTNREFLAGIV
jgi:hypothetical protein